MYRRTSKRDRLATSQTRLWSRLRVDCSGAGIVEYALLAALISVVTMGAMVVVSEEQDETYDCLSATIEMGEESIICAEIGTLS